MKTLISFSFTILFLLGCAEKHVKIKEIRQPIQETEETNRNVIRYNNSNIKNIIDLLNSKQYIEWENSEILVVIDKNKLNYFYHMQCIYEYNYEISGDSIIMKWGLNGDCVFDRELNKTFRNIYTPKVNQAFASITLKNDTLRFNYIYKDWVNQMNIYCKDVDTLFPNYFTVWNY